MKHAAAIRTIVAEHMVPESSIAQALEAIAVGVEDLEARVARLEGLPAGGLFAPTNAAPSTTAVG